MHWRVKVRISDPKGVELIEYSKQYIYVTCLRVQSTYGFRTCATLSCGGVLRNI
ncbi:hypothetical protein M422DRAFT_39172 [Sphaerobolus stellatus SS14]|uniref:Uncharacterized protein n=1 Tax=Sphaerobolus stellatus (strain SS14) TaxID=990650 RepID=A0A0C9U5S8_SPHS4|nr:hypothetical protein M422DRAFT_39172 [Sphaerobolus stellatus SS14]